MPSSLMRQAGSSQDDVSASSSIASNASSTAPLIDDDAHMEKPKAVALPARHPRSAFKLFGQHWYLGAEDMIMPTCCALVFDVALLAIAIAARILFDKDDAVYHVACSSEDYTWINDTITLEVRTCWVVSQLEAFVGCLSPTPRACVFCSGRCWCDPSLLFLSCVLLFSFALG